MKILALEASTEYCSVALWRDGECDMSDVLAGQRHSQLMLGMVDALLARRKLRLAELDGIAFGAGPGAFTGLRIACGLAQGLAFGSGIPVTGVSTLAATAEASGGERVLCCLDARVHEIYHAAYVRLDAGWATVHPPALCAPDAAPELPDGGWLACGSGFAAYRKALLQRYEGRLAAVDAAIRPRASEVAKLGAAQFERGEGVEAVHAAPIYLRDKVALKTHER